MVNSGIPVRCSGSVAAHEICVHLRPSAVELGTEGSNNQHPTSNIEHRTSNNQLDG